MFMLAFFERDDLSLRILKAKGAIACAGDLICFVLFFLLSGLGFCCPVSLEACFGGC